MSKRAKQKRQSPYRQRSLNPMGGLGILADRQPMSDGQLTDLALGYWIAFDNMTMNASTEYDWNIVTGSLNIGIVMCEEGINEEAMDLFKRALDASFKTKQRGERTGVWRYDGGDIETIRNALAAHDQQCGKVNQGTMVNVIRDVQKRVDSGLVYTEAAA